MPAPPTTTARHRRWERLGLAGLALAVVTAGVLLVVAPADSTDTELRTRAELQALVDRWADAVRHGDHEAMASVVDVDAAVLFDSEMSRARSLAAIPLSDFGYELGQEPGLSVPDEITARYGPDAVRAQGLYLRYAVDGIDDEPTRRPVTALFVRRPDGWRLADDAPDLPGAATWRGPWDHGPRYVVSVDTAGGRSMVIGSPARRDLTEAIADEFDAAVDAVSDVWGDEWPQRALVVVTGSREEFTHQVGTRHDGDHIAAVSVSDAVDPERGTATGRRIVFGPDAGGRLTGAGLRAVLRHEMVHVAARTDTVDGSPLWILEGYADYVGYRGSGTDVRRIAPTLASETLVSGPPAELPDDADFASGERARAAYEKAWSIAAFTADEFGTDRLTELYRALARGPITPDRLDDVLGDVVGLKADEFVEQWGEWLSIRLGR